MAKGTQKIIRMDGVRLSFPVIWNPEAMKQGDKPACSAHFIMAPDSAAAKTVKAALSEVANAAWGDQGPTMLQQLIQQDRVCLHKGDSKTGQDGTVLEGYEGNLYVSARSAVRPTVVDQQKQPLTEADGKPYAGCYVNAVVAIWAQTGGQYGKRLNAQLQGVQFAGDGDAFGGGKAASPDAFENLEGEFGAGPAGDPFGDAGGESEADSLI